MSIPALRTSVRNIVEPHLPAEHPGLTLYRYHSAIDSNDTSEKGAERQKIISYMTSKLPDRTFALYKKAYERWESWLRKDPFWCRSQTLEARDKLFIGLGGASVLEFGITLHHVYGLPMIPGSALKGLCAHYAHEVWGAIEEDWKYERELHRVMFGNPDTKDCPATAGAIDFLDAWWKPTSSGSPFAPEIINPHHPTYYGADESDNQKPPADWDSPIPVKMLAVTGTFLFAVRGPVHWNDLVMKLLPDALSDWGIGGKTRSGYGRFKKSAAMAAAESRVVWEATLVYTPNNGTLTATNTENKSEKATLSGGKPEIGKIVPEAYHNQLWGRRRRAVTAKVEVEPIGGKAFSIISIEPKN